MTKFRVMTQPADVQLAKLGALFFKFFFLEDNYTVLKRYYLILISNNILLIKKKYRSWKKR